MLINAGSLPSDSVRDRTDMTEEFNCFWVCMWWLHVKSCKKFKVVVMSSTSLCLHYIIILIWVYYWLLLILISQVNWLLLQFRSNKTLFICELTLWFFLFFPAFPCSICAHQVCQLAPAGPVGAGTLHWLWENISAMAVLRLWVILKWAFYLWSYVLWTENNFVKSVWPSVMGMKMWVKWERSGLGSSLCSLAFVFATHTYWVVLFVTKGHRYCRWQHNPGNNNYSPWLAFGGLAVSA